MFSLACDDPISTRGQARSSRLVCGKISRSTHKAPGETLLHVSREVITHAANMLQPIAPLTARLPQPPLDATDTSNGDDGCRWRELWQGTAPLSSFFSSVRSIHSSLPSLPLLTLWCVLAVTCLMTTDTVRCSCIDRCKLCTDWC